MNEIQELSENESEQRDAPEPVSEEELRRRYVEQMSGLADDARVRGMLPLFVEVAAWKLAVIACAYGPLAAGDVVRQLGFHMHSIARADQAQREADEARAQGHLPH